MESIFPDEEGLTSEESVLETTFLANGSFSLVHRFLAWSGLALLLALLHLVLLWRCLVFNGLVIQCAVDDYGWICVRFRHTRLCLIRSYLANQTAMHDNGWICFRQNGESRMGQPVISVPISLDSSFFCFWSISVCGVICSCSTNVANRAWLWWMNCVFVWLFSLSSAKYDCTQDSVCSGFSRVDHILTRQFPLRLSRGGIGLYFGASIAALLWRPFLDLPRVNSHDVGSVFSACGHLEF